MSASREKKKRQELGQAGMLPSQKKAAEEKKKKQKNLLIGCIVAVLILAAAVYSLFSLVILPNRAPKAEALTVGSHDLTAAELNYYYIDTVYSFCNNYSSYLSYFLDTSKPLDEQYYDEDNQQTWADPVALRGGAFAPRYHPNDARPGIAQVFCNGKARPASRRPLRNGRRIAAPRGFHRSPAL